MGANALYSVLLLNKIEQKPLNKKALLQSVVLVITRPVVFSTLVLSEVS